jgi:hypothetical protein
MLLPLFALKLFLPLLPRRNTFFHILSIIHELFNDFNLAAFIIKYSCLSSARCYSPRAKTIPTTTSTLYILSSTYSQSSTSCLTTSMWPHSSPKLNYRTTMWTRSRSLYDFIPIFLTATNKSQKAIIDEYLDDLIVAAFVIEAKLRHSDLNSKSIDIKLLA